MCIKICHDKNIPIQAIPENVRRYLLNHYNDRRVICYGIRSPVII